MSEIDEIRRIFSPEIANLFANGNIPSEEQSHEIWHSIFTHITPALYKHVRDQTARTRQVFPRFLANFRLAKHLADHFGILNFTLYDYNLPETLRWRHIQDCMRHFFRYYGEFNSSYKSRIDELYNNLTALTELKAKFSAGTPEEMRIAIIQANRRIQSLNTELSQLKIANSNFAKLETDLKNELQDIIDKISAASSTKRALNDKLKATKSNTKLLKRNRKHRSLIQIESRLIKDRLINKTAKLDALKTRTERLVKLSDTFSLAILKLKGITAHKKECLAAKSIYSKQERALQLIKTRISDFNIRIADCEKQVRKMEEEISEQTHKSEVLKAQSAELEQRANSLNAENTAEDILLKERESLQLQLQNITTDLDSVNRNLSVVDELAQVRKEISEKSKQIQEEMRQHHILIIKLKNKTGTERSNFRPDGYDDYEFDLGSDNDPDFV